MSKEQAGGSGAGAPILTLTELRVLSGLSRGAALPLDDTIKIGSDFANDLILVDPGIAPEQAQITQGDDGGLLLRERSADGVQWMAPRNIVAGRAFDLCGIAMMVCESDAEWDFSLPVPPPPAHVPSPIDAAVADGIASGRLGAKVIAGPQPMAKGRSSAKWILALALAVACLLAGVVFVQFDSPASHPVVVAPVVVPRSYTEAEVQAIAQKFADVLEDAGIRGLKLVTALQQLTIQGYLDRNEEGRFEAAVQELRDSHPGLKVKLDLDSDPSSQLPFDVTAAVGGSSGSVLLGDGQQLFVGAEEQGFKFLGLSGNCLNFLQVATQQKVSKCSDQSQRRR